MSIEYIFFRFWRVASIVAAIIGLFVAYVGFPETVAVHHTSAGVGDGFLSKQELFYWVAGIILGFWILGKLLGRYLGKVLPQLLSKTSKWQNPIDALPHLAEAWASFLVAIVNTFIILVLRALSVANRESEQILKQDFSWLLYVGIFFMLAFLLYLPLNLSLSSPPKED